uniref:Uncharacterized protein n=1 Tax=Oryza rufipogon TaxID=4529 RepID=A0A0E0QEC5_ORYRU
MAVGFESNDQPSALHRIPVPSADSKRQAGTGEEATRERKFHWKQRRHAMATRGQEGTCGTASGIARRGRPRGAGVSTLAGMRCDGGRRRTNYRC